MANVNAETFPGQKELQELIERVKRAQIMFASFSQEQVDKIFREAAIAANNARITLAQDAVQETGMGIVEDKVIKNHFAAEYIFHKYKDEKTCGIIEEESRQQIRQAPQSSNHSSHSRQETQSSSHRTRGQRSAHAMQPAS